MYMHICCIFRYLLRFGADWKQIWRKGEGDKDAKGQMKGRKGIRQWGTKNIYH
jgi:hypothetical protein